MKCLRCGYCCTRLLAVVVVDPDKGIRQDNLTTIGMSGEEERCLHLRGEVPGEYSCAVHDREWFSETPCAAYQSHWPERPCRMGEFLLAHQKEKVMKNGKNGKLELTVYLNEAYLRGYTDRSDHLWQQTKKELQRHIREAIDETSIGVDIIFDSGDVCDPGESMVTAYHNSNGELVTDAVAKQDFDVRVASGLRRRVAATVNDYLKTI